MVLNENKKMEEEGGGCKLPVKNISKMNRKKQQQSYMIYQEQSQQDWSKMEEKKHHQKDIGEMRWNKRSNEHIE